MQSIGRWILKIFVFQGEWLLFYYLIDLTGFAQINVITSLLSVFLVFICAMAVTIIVFQN
ncbi:hypothetical protein P343_15615 [Sporolactobacillus laevolacticus DSM 442]|uniref:Uncharacterized protein n=1 Tax=Sporolactobacillus laevolacticus DSM 442 TaxID=1395513 RepID=V6IUT5_9BACL|nr:hypothetical protein P343_15615 [Sporolactobacillus laevolacticus DSM 442]